MALRTFEPLHAFVTFATDTLGVLQKKIATAASALQAKTTKLEEQRAAAAEAGETLPAAEERVQELQAELDAAEEELTAFRLTIQDEVRPTA